MSSPGQKSRLDQALVSRGLIATRAKARDAILRGAVMVDGILATKPGQQVGGEVEITLDADPSPFVSRAGLKLAHALDQFGIDPWGLIALDIGASTGGFTDVLLKRGAAHVTAIDVGHGQLHHSLCDDARVTLLEGLNARNLAPDQLLSPPDLVVCDVSFISLKLALAAALPLTAPVARLVALVKPQFEVGRDGLGKGGIVRDPALHKKVCEDICAWVNGQDGWSTMSLVPSPIEGADGNREFLLCAFRF